MPKLRQSRSRKRQSLKKQRSRRKKEDWTLSHRAERISSAVASRSMTTILATPFTISPSIRRGAQTTACRQVLGSLPIRLVTGRRRSRCRRRCLLKTRMVFSLFLVRRVSLIIECIARTQQKGRARIQTASAPRRRTSNPVAKATNPDLLSQQ